MTVFTFGWLLSRLIGSFIHMFVFIWVWIDMGVNCNLTGWRMTTRCQSKELLIHSQLTDWFNALLKSLNIKHNFGEVKGFFFFLLYFFHPETWTHHLPHVCLKTGVLHTGIGFGLNRLQRPHNKLKGVKSIGIHSREQCWDCLTGTQSEILWMENI